MTIENKVQKPHGDAIDGVKRIKNTFSLIFCDGLFKSDVKLKLHCPFWNFQNWRKFDIGRTFSSYMSPEVECVISIANPMSYILSFWSTLLLKY